MSTATNSTSTHLVAWQCYLFVALGGALGGAGRYNLSLVFAGAATGLPWATLLANMIGSFIIGFYSALPRGSRYTGERAQIFISVGFCGGFTTFSIFSLEVLTLLQQQQWLQASVWLTLSVTLWLLAVTLGYLVGKRVNAT